MREWADSVTIYFLVFGWTSLFSISRVPPLSLLWSVLQPCKPCERLTRGLLLDSHEVTLYLWHIALLCSRVFVVLSSK